MLDAIANEPVNGLDLEALGSAVDAIRLDPAKAKAAFQVTTSWLGQTRSESVVDGFELGGERIVRSHRIAADEPVQLLGSDTAPNPQELLMAAFNACLMVGYVAQAALKGIALESVVIATRGGLDLRGFLGLDELVPPGYEEIDYEVRISGAGSPEDFEEIHQAVLKTSPNYFNINRAIRVNASLRVG